MFYFIVSLPTSMNQSSTTTKKCVCVCMCVYVYVYVCVCVFVGAALKSAFSHTSAERRQSLLVGY